jgi:hypothetical protein
VAEVLSRAARDIRRILDEPDGNLVRPEDEESIADAASAIAFALSDFCREATIHTAGETYRARLVPRVLAAVSVAARELGLVAGGHVHQRKP